MHLARSVGPFPTIFAIIKSAFEILAQIGARAWRGVQDRAIAALNRPHICRLYDVGLNYVVMEPVDVPSSHKEGAFSLAEASGLARQVADALELGAGGVESAPQPIPLRRCLLRSRS